MVIFTDRHHDSLAASLKYLLEDRLGHTLYFPIGMEWYEKGYWAIFNHIDTAKQFLEKNSVPTDGTRPLNNMEGEVIIDKHNNVKLKALTFHEFMKTPVDVIIASIPAHIKPFKELAVKKGAKFVFQMGNVFPEVNLNEIPNLMANTLPTNIPPTCHYTQYFQEFDLNIFKPSDSPPKRLITNFVNILNKNSGFVDYLTLKLEMPEWEFKSYGAQNENGILNTTQEIADKMRESAWGFHSKHDGDGYGHIFFNWFACGKPIITRFSDYKGKIGELMLFDMETAIDIDKHSVYNIKSIIENMPPHVYKYMCQQAYNKFCEVVDFKKDSETIKYFLSKLQ